MAKALNAKCMEWFECYKKWISQNPALISDVENTVKCLSFFSASKLNGNSLASEFVYSLPNLLVLFNDHLIKTRWTSRKIPSLQSKIKIWLTVIDYTETLLEVSSKRAWGESGRWFVITLIQFLKVTMRLLLVFRYKERITQTPAIPPLNREKLNEDINIQVPKDAYALKRSGAVIRSVRSSITQTRTWTPPTTHIAEKAELSNGSANVTKKSLIIAETLYIIKPLLHLGCLSLSGPKNWNPWLLSFFIDLVSLKLHNTETTLNREEQEELCRRRIGLLLYILRSPFYDNCSRMKIFAILNTLSRTVPLAKLIAEPIARYLPHWQSTYFYMWSC